MRWTAVLLVGCAYSPPATKATSPSATATTLGEIGGSYSSPASSGAACPATLPDPTTTAAGCALGGDPTDLDSQVNVTTPDGALCPDRVCSGGTVELLFTVVNPCPVDVAMTNSPGLVEWTLAGPQDTIAASATITTTPYPPTVPANGTLPSVHFIEDLDPGPYTFSYVWAGGPADGSVAFCME